MERQILGLVEMIFQKHIVALMGTKFHAYITIAKSITYEINNFKRVNVKYMKKKN